MAKEICTDAALKIEVPRPRQTVVDQYAKEVEILGVYMIICVTGTFGIALMMVHTMFRAGRFKNMAEAGNKAPAVRHVYQVKVGRVCCHEKHAHTGEAHGTQTHQTHNHTSAEAVDDVAE